MRPLAWFVPLLLLPGIAAAQEARPQPLQELFLTETVYPQEKGEVQLTFGTLLDRTPAAHAALLPLAIEYGLTNRWQMEAGWDGFTRSQASPFSGVHTARYALGTKYSFMHIGGSPVHAALGIDAEFPNADALPDDEGEGSLEFEPVAALAVALGARLTVFGSAAISWAPGEVAALVEHAARPDDPGTLGLGGLVAFRHLTAAVEYTNRSDALPWRLDGAPLLTPSIVMHPGHEWELGFGTPIALRSGARQPGLAAHIIKEF